MSRLERGAEMQNGPHTCVWWLRIRKNISATEVPSKGVKDHSPAHQAPQPRVPVAKRGAPQHLAVKNTGYSNCLGEQEGYGKHICPLKQPAHRLTGSQALTLGSSRRAMTWGASETHRHAD